MDSLIAHVKPQVHSCQYCQKVILPRALITNQSRWSEFFTVPLTEDEVLQAAEKECPLFSGMKAPVETKAPVEMALKKESHHLHLIKPSNFFKALTHFGKSKRTAPDEDPMHPVELYTIYSGVLGVQPSLHSRLKKDSYPNFSISAFANDPAASLCPRRPNSYLIKTHDYFQFFSDQISKCQQEHISQGTCLPRLTSGFSPRKLIEISSSGGDIVLRLINPAQGSSLRWCALSYCWGGAQPYMTTKANLTQRYSSIEFNELGKTLQDGIFCCIQLQINYIWIDSICIVQDDPELGEDLDAMPDIFNLAWATISASSARTALDGFLSNNITPNKLRHPPYMLRCALSDFQDGNIPEIGNLVIEPRSPSYRENDPIHSRGWIFQERFLSPRILDFSDSMVQWRCPTLRVIETDPTQPMTEYNSSISRLDEFFVRNATHECRRDHGDWNQIVLNYTQRDLTYPEDKLRAISGVAKRFNPGCRYLAGLWERDFPGNLVWEANSSFMSLKNIPNTRPGKYLAPSWSWASLAGRIENSTFRSAGVTEWILDDLEIINCEVEPLYAKAPFGPVKSGYLTVRGYVQSCIFKPEYPQFRRLSLTDASSHAEHCFYENFDTSEDEEKALSGVPLWCLLVVWKVKNAPSEYSDKNEAARGLVLCREDSGNYSRIGTWKWSDDYAGKISAFGDRTTITII